MAHLPADKTLRKTGEPTFIFQPRGVKLQRTNGPWTGGRRPDQTLQFPVETTPMEF